MEFKYASEDEVHARQKFHARTRLAAALKFATQLDAITKASPRVNAFTKLEAHAYFNYIAGTFFLEKRRWPNALGHYRQAK
jgi:hypothetical protein